ncbi:MULTISPECIES: hypothetical protein [unclassified Rickettsia]
MDEKLTQKNRRCEEVQGVFNHPCNNAGYPLNSSCLNLSEFSCSLQ